MEAIRLFLTGDVMTGRGIDQALPHPGDPALFEAYAKSAGQYVALAEKAHGAISRPLDFRHIWGDALETLDRERPDARIINLETAVTTSRTPEPKGINYKMHPANMPVLTVAGIDCCVLSNNHVLDWGEAGLYDTLDALKRAGIRTAGAGSCYSEASQPAVVDVRPGRRISVYGVGSKTSGIPPHWAASEKRPGVRLLPDLSERTAERLAEEILSSKQAGDVTVLSVHWGSNWGHAIPREQRRLAHRLIESGACDIVHGHSSHHPRAIEIHRGKLILYGCGDFINDYEGIPGKEEYRGDLSVMYLPAIDPANGALVKLDLIVFQMRRFRLRYASQDDIEWLRDVLTRESRSFGARFALKPGGLEAAGA